jgi:hypothetical protein
MKYGKFYTLILCISLLSSLAFLPAKGQPSVPILIDGFFNDWAGVPVFLNDPMGDPGLIIPPEDISSARITQAKVMDDPSPIPRDRVFFQYNHFHDAQLDNAMVYSIWLDTIPGEGDPVSKGTDFIISFGLHLVEATGIWVSFDGIPILNVYNETSGDFDYVECEGLEAAYGIGPDSGLSIEFGVPLECIGSPECFNVFFFTFTTGGPGSDYAPDLDVDEYVQKRYCIPSPEPVGGEILSSAFYRNSVIYVLMGAQMMILFLNLKKNPVSNS